MSVVWCGWSTAGLLRSRLLTEGQGLLLQLHSGPAQFLHVFTLGLTGEYFVRQHDRLVVMTHLALDCGEQFDALEVLGIPPPTLQQRRAFSQSSTRNAAWA